MLEANLVQQAPAPLQHHPARRQALPLPQAHDRRGVPAAAGGPAGPQRRRHLLRPVLPGHGHAGDAAAGAGCCSRSAPARITIDGRLAAPLHPVLRSTAATRRARAGRRAKATRERCAEVQRFLEGKNDDVAAGADRGDGAGGGRGEASSGRPSSATGSRPSTRSGSGRRSSRPRRPTRTSSASCARGPRPAWSSSSCARGGWSARRRSSSTRSRAGATARSCRRSYASSTSRSVTPAPEILLSEEIADAELITEWLSGLARPPGPAGRPPAGQPARVRGHGRGERRPRAPEPSARRGTTARPTCWRSCGARSAWPPPPTGSRATTSPTSRGPSRSAPWSCGRTAG